MGNAAKEERAYVWPLPLDKCYWTKSLEEALPSQYSLVEKGKLLHQEISQRAVFGNL